MAVKPVPDGYHTVTPYLIVQGAARLIDFLKEAFGATEIQRMAQEDGIVKHAELRIGDSRVMMAEAGGDFPAMPCSIHLYVPDADSQYRKALQAGGASIMEMATQFYGDRSGGIKDPSGNSWWISTHVEDVSPEDMQKRAAAAMKEYAAKQAKPASVAASTATPTPGFGATEDKVDMKDTVPQRVDAKGAQAADIAGFDGNDSKGG